MRFTFQTSPSRFAAIRSPLAVEVTLSKPFKIPKVVTRLRMWVLGSIRSRPLPPSKIAPKVAVTRSPVLTIGSAATAAGGATNAAAKGMRVATVTAAAVAAARRRPRVDGEDMGFWLLRPVSPMDDRLSSTLSRLACRTLAPFLTRPARTRQAHCKDSAGGRVKHGWWHQSGACEPLKDDDVPPALLARTRLPAATRRVLAHRRRIEPTPQPARRRPPRGAPGRPRTAKTAGFCRIEEHQTRSVGSTHRHLVSASGSALPAGLAGGVMTFDIPALLDLWTRPQLDAAKAAETSR